MKMETLLSIILLVTATDRAFAQTEPAHEWKVALKVVDETGQPVAGAETWVNYLTNRFVGLTDTNGIFTASHLDHSVQLAFQAQKTGYYSFGIQHLLGFHYDPAKWNSTVELLLNRIINPIPMYAKSVSYSMRTNGQPIGYDLITGDWVAPYGQGRYQDVIFTSWFDKRSESDYDYSLTVSFPNRGDGIQGFEFPYPVGQGSALRSPHEAPEHGYESELVKSEKARSGEFVKYIWDEKTNYLFRVRTVLDEHGNVKSALYGKIYGDFNRYRYYLNPTPNDRNLEFDPKHNLLGGLKSIEQVDAP
jgi:hypothetical protein